jgi:hypothetical protein
MAAIGDDVLAKLNADDLTIGDAMIDDVTEIGEKE